MEPEAVGESATLLPNNGRAEPALVASVKDEAQLADDTEQLSTGAAIQPQAELKSELADDEPGPSSGLHDRRGERNCGSGPAGQQGSLTVETAPIGEPSCAGGGDLSNSEGSLNCMSSPEDSEPSPLPALLSSLTEESEVAQHQNSPLTDSHEHVAAVPTLATDVAHDGADRRGASFLDNAADHEDSGTSDVEEGSIDSDVGSEHSPLRPLHGSFPRPPELHIDENLQLLLELAEDSPITPPTPVASVHSNSNTTAAFVVWASAFPHVLLTIVHLGSICVTLSSALVLGLQKHSWAFAGVTIGFWAIDMFMLILIIILVMRKKKADAYDGVREQRGSCFWIKNTVVAANMIGITLHQLPLLFVHAYAALALRRDAAVHAISSEVAIAERERLDPTGITSDHGGSDSSSGSGLDLRFGATNDPIADVTAQLTVKWDRDWNWNLDLSQSLLWTSFILSASAIALGFVLLEFKVAEHRLKEEGRVEVLEASSPGSDDDSSTKKLTSVYKALLKLECSVFFHRLPELLARVELISISAIIFPAWFILVVVLGCLNTCFARAYFSLKIHRADPRSTLQRLPGLLLVYITAARPREYNQPVSEFSAFAGYHTGREFFLSRGFEYIVAVGLILLFGRGDADDANNEQVIIFESMRAPLVVFSGLIFTQLLAMCYAFTTQKSFQRALVEARRAADRADTRNGILGLGRRRSSRRRRVRDLFPGLQLGEEDDGNGLPPEPSDYIPPQVKFLLKAGRVRRAVEQCALAERRRVALEEVDGSGDDVGRQQLFPPVAGSGRGLQRMQFRSTSPAMSIAGKQWVLQAGSLIAKHQALAEASIDSLVTGGEDGEAMQTPARKLIIDVRRGMELADALAGVGKVEAGGLTGRIDVRFVNEDGIDDGALTRELLAVVGRSLSNSPLQVQPTDLSSATPDRSRLFYIDSNGKLVPEPCAYRVHGEEEADKLYRGVGRLAGFAFTTGNHFDASFCRAFVEALLMSGSVDSETCGARRWHGYASSGITGQHGRNSQGDGNRRWDAEQPAGRDVERRHRRRRTEVELERRMAIRTDVESQPLNESPDSSVGAVHGGSVPAPEPSSEADSSLQEAADEMISGEESNDGVDQQPSISNTGESVQLSDRSGEETSSLLHDDGGGTTHRIEEDETINDDGETDEDDDDLDMTSRRLQRLVRVDAGCPRNIDDRSPTDVASTSNQEDCAVINWLMPWLHESDPVLAGSLEWLLQDEGLEEGEDRAQDMGPRSFDWTVATAEFCLGPGANVIDELEPGGSKIELAHGNRHRYVRRVLEYNLVTTIAKPAAAFRQGILDVITEPLLLSRALFGGGWSEFSEIMSGRDRGITLEDVEDWCSVTGYQNGFDANHPTIIMFWQAVSLDLSSAERAALLGFTTGCPRVPAGGFASLQLGHAAGHLDNVGRRPRIAAQRFFIRRVHPSPTHMLPTAGVCANVLNIPEYKDRASMVERIRYALEYGGVGFGMH